MIRTRGWTNHARYLSFAREGRRQWEAERFDAVVEFNKMPGLDLCFAGDSSYLGKTRTRRGWLTRLTTRYRCYLALEAGVFEPSG